MVAPHTRFDDDLVDAGEPEAGWHSADLLVEFTQRCLHGILVGINSAPGYGPLAIAPMNPVRATGEEQAVDPSLAMAQQHPGSTEASPNDAARLQRHPAITRA